MSILITLFILWAILVMGAVLWTRNLARGAVEIVPQAGILQEVDGGVMHYVDIGPRDGPVLVMIHGISGQLQHMTYGLAGELTDEFRVIALDRLGCGYSSVTGGHGASLADQARMIDGLLGAIGVDRAVLVGHSLGGAVALRMALDFPDRVTSLALFCPLTQDLSEAPSVFKGLQIKSPRVRRILGATIAVPIARLTAPKVLDQVFAPEKPPRDFVARAGAVLGLRPQSFVTACADAEAVQSGMSDLVSRYGCDLKAPVGILFGADDKVLSPEVHGEGMAADGLVYETLAGRGHMIPLTAPKDCAAFVRRMA